MRNLFQIFGFVFSLSSIFSVVANAELASNATLLDTIGPGASLYFPKSLPVGASHVTSNGWQMGDCIWFLKSDIDSAGNMDQTLFKEFTIPKGARLIIQKRDLDPKDAPYRIKFDFKDNIYGIKAVSCFQNDVDLVGKKASKFTVRDLRRNMKWAMWIELESTPTAKVEDVGSSKDVKANSISPIHENKEYERSIK